MSIVICVVDKNSRFYMASDLRAIRDGIIYDDYQKVFELKPRVYFGMTGIAEAGHAVLDKLRPLTKLSVDEIIKKTDEIIQYSSTILTVMLAGQNEQGDFFIPAMVQPGRFSLENGKLYPANQVLAKLSSLANAFVVSSNNSSGHLLPTSSGTSSNDTYSNTSTV